MNYRELRARLAPLYGESEARAVTDMLLSETFGLAKADVLCGAVERMSLSDTAKLEQLTQRLERFEPVQYVIGHAEFCGRRFKVAPCVLIPRPETEELCAWIEEECASGNPQKALDVGTGSGCIACTLALDIRQSEVEAWDISAEALAIARENAARLGARVSFKQQNALRKKDDSPQWNIIVSNPPYICLSERKDMERNVLEHEPHSALFVPDNDPLLFYRAISRYAAASLLPGGRLFYEINPQHARETVAMLRDMNFKKIVVRDDSYGKERMVSASLS